MSQKNQDISQRSATKKNPEDEAQDVAAKVQILFEHCRKENGDRWTPAEIEDFTRDWPHRIHGSWLSRLLRAQAPRPSLWVLKALSDFFDVEPTYWFEPTGTLPQRRHHAVTEGSVVAMRSQTFISEMADDLTLEDQRYIGDLIVRLRRGTKHEAGTE